MRKSLLAIAALFCSLALLPAQQQETVKTETTAAKPTAEQSNVQLKPTNEWTFLQVGFLPGVPGCTENSNVYGIKLGLPLVDGDGRVCGMEPSFLYSGTSYVSGLQASWFGPSIAKTIKGVQGSIPINITDKISGFQGSVSNVSLEEVKGVQAGAVSVGYKVSGAQLSAVNVVADELKGFQFGVVNYSDSKGVQLGFINIIKDGYIPFTLIFNCSN